MDDLNSFNISAENIDSPITEYLRNKTIFLTGKSTFDTHENLDEFALSSYSVLNKKFLHLYPGGNGFVGKILIEKLLRCDVKKIFIMMRPKKQKNLHQRFEALIEDPVRWNIEGLFTSDVFKYLYLMLEHFHKFNQRGLMAELFSTSRPNYCFNDLAIMGSRLGSENF